MQSGGPSWELPLGRRDSKTASLSDSNRNIPPPNSTLQNLITLFKQQGLDEVDLVALSGKLIVKFVIHDGDANEILFFRGFDSLG